MSPNSTPKPAVTDVEWNRTRSSRDAAQRGRTTQGELRGNAETVQDYVQQLLSRAEDARAVAAGMVRPETRLMLFALAKCYQSLAECVARSAGLDEVLRDISAFDASCEPTKAK